MVTTVGTAGEEIRESVLGMRWGASPADVMAAHPAARQVIEGSTFGIVVPPGLLGVRATPGDIFILTLTPEAGLEEIAFQVASEDVSRLAAAVEHRFGPGRSAVGQTIFGSFEHVREWSCPDFGLRITWSTRDESATSPPLAIGAVRVQRGPLVRSIVDDMALPPIARRRTLP